MGPSSTMFVLSKSLSVLCQQDNGSVSLSTQDFFNNKSLAIIIIYAMKLSILFSFFKLCHYKDLALQ